MGLVILYLQNSIVPLPDGDHRSFEGLKTGGLAARPVVPGSLAHVLQQCSAAQRGACECDRSCTRLSGGPWRGRSLTEEAIRPGKERRETGWIVFGPAVA